MGAATKLASATRRAAAKRITFPVSTFLIVCVKTSPNLFTAYHLELVTLRVTCTFGASDILVAPQMEPLPQATGDRQLARPRKGDRHRSADRQANTT